MRLRIKQLGKDSVVYGFGSVFAGLISILLLPVYTRIFSPQEFGIIEIILAFAALVGVIMGLGMDAAQSFYFFKVQRKGRGSQRRLVSSIMQLRLLWGAFVLAAALAVVPWIRETVFSDSVLPLSYFAAALAGIFFTQIMQQCAEIFRLLYQPWQFICISLVNSVTAAAVTIGVVVFLEWGILGYFFGFSAGAVTAAALGIFKIKAFVNFRVLYAHWWPRLIRLGAPLVSGVLAMYVLHMADRWFLSAYTNPAELGLYAVAAKITLIITVAVNTFRKAWWPVAMDALHSEDGKDLFRLIARYFLGAGVAGILIMTMAAPFLFHWLVSPEFYESYRIVGVLSWSPVFFGLSLTVAGGIWKREKTHFLPVLAGTAAVMNVALNAWLIPKWGAMGAAWATSLSFGLWIVLTCIVSERLWRVRYSLTTAVFQIVAGVVGCGMLYYTQWSLSSVAAGCALCISILLVTFRDLPGHLKSHHVFGEPHS